METKKTQRSKKPLLITIFCLMAAAIIFGVVLMLTQCDDGAFTPNGGALGKQLAAEGTATITLNEDVILDAPLVVNGNKTIIGSGKILLKVKQDGSWPESEKPSWGMGCATVEAEDASAMPAALQVSKDASLNLQGSITVDAEGNANGIRLESGAQLKLSETAVIKNGRYANLIIAEGAQAEIAGGEIADGSKFNILNHGTLNVTGGAISGAKTGANIYSTGAFTQSEGTVSLSGLHNVYIAAGSFAMTGGANTSAAKDGIVVAEGAKADITGGEISVCIHGLCNNGQTSTGKLTFSECGIMNYEGAVLDIKGTTVDTSEVYCLANSGGKITAEDFTAKKCDTVAVYNFSGDMILKNLTITGGRDGNLTNAGGNMTVDGAHLDVCRDKSVVVGNGKAVLNNVKISGNSKDKYGVYTFGGELYLNDSSIENVSSTAVKADPGSYVELNNVTIKDVAQNGFQTEGGRVVIHNVTLQNVGSHGIYNNGGEVTVNKMQITGVEKNAVQHKSGTTTVTGLAAKTMGNHGAYVEEGTLTIKDSAFEGMTANGFYIVKGENKLVLEGVSIKDAKQQGINNDSVVEVKNVTIENVGNNGIYNKTGASITIDGLKVTNAGEHGVSNKSKMTAKNIVITGTGKGSNGVQNNGTLTLTGAKITASKNHGIYNTGKLTASDVQIDGTQDNGIYNDGGEVTVSKLEVSNAKGQGINNKGALNLKDVAVTGAGKNGIYHAKGSAKVENLTVSNTAEHGVNNAAQMELVNVTISKTGEGKNGLQNSGELTVTKLSVAESANHGIYNTGKLTASDVTIKTAGDNGIYNDGGEVTASKLEVSNAKGQGINNKGALNLKDVTVTGAGKNGIYHAKGSAKVENLTVSDTAEHGVNNAAQMELVNVTISKTGEGKNGLQNSGELTVTKLSIAESANHGIYNTGKLTASDVTIKTAGDNGIYNDGGEVTASKLEVSNAKGQGINNKGALNLKDVTVTGAGKNGVYHSKGSAKVENLTVTDTAEHGVNNAAKLELANITISKTGAGKNGLQNSGELTVTKLSITESANHGIYNTGKLTASDVTVKTVGDNGIYNDGGEVTASKLEVSNAKGQGVNNAGTLNLKDVTIAGAGKNGIYHAKGSAKVENLTVSNTAEHGVNNAAQMELVNVTISKTGEDKNGLQNSGELTITSLKIEGSKKHGIYNNGKLTGSKIEIKNSGDNGLYNDGGEVTALKEMVIEGAVNQGINNTGIFGAENVKISRTGKNGVMNKVGTIALKNLTVSLIGEHGVNNDENGTATLENICIDGSGAGKNNLQNQATMSVKDAELSASSNHGVYNTGTLTVTGELKITGAAVNGIYNYQGIAALEQIEVVAPGEHGINNAAHMTVGKVTVTESVQNAIQNSGTMAITGAATLLDSGKHGIYNSGAFNGKNMIVTNAFDLLLSNSGEMVIDYLKLSGTAHKAVYNAGYAELYNAIIDGKQIRNPSETATGAVYEAEYLVDNNNGVLDLEDTLICNAFGTAVHNRGTANTNFTNVEINGAGNYGVFVEGRASIGGDGLVIRNITKNADVKNAEGIALKLQGRTTMLDHVVIENVTNQNAVVLDATTAVYSGIGLTVKNVPNGGAVYNKGMLYVTDLVIEEVANGVIGRYDGKAILSGTVTIKNVKQSPIRTYGADDDKNGVKYQNSVTLSPKTEMTIDGCGSHAINNKGSFLAAADSKIIIKNVKGTNINAINNNKGTMTLGDVLVDGMQVNITMYKDTTINSNASNALQTSGKLELNGDLVVKNVFYKAANNRTDNSNGAGVVVKSGGSITGTGSITIIGNQTAPEGYAGLFNGLFIDGCTVDIDGDISVSNTKNQGIYAANSNAKLECANITISNVGANGLYVNNQNGKLNVQGNVEISNAGQNGLFNVGKSTIEGNVTIRDINGGHNGVRNDGSGNLTIKGDLTMNGIGGTTTSTGRGNAVASNGRLTVNGDLTISGVTASGDADNSSNNAIYGKGVITVGGNVKVTDKVAAGHGVFLDQGKLLVTGDIEINGSGSGKQGIYGANETVSNGAVTKTAEIQAANITVRNAGGNGIYINKTSNKLIATGNIVISGSAGGHGLNTTGIVNAANITISNTTKSDMNGIEAKSGSKMTVTGAITITNSGKRGLNNPGEVKAASLTIDGFGENGIQNAGTLEITGAVIITNSTGTGHGMYNSMTFKAGSLSISNVSRNGINNGGSLTVAGEISVKNAVQGGIGNSSGKNITAGSVTIDTVTAGPGINNAGTMTVTGLTSVKNITGTAINAVNNNGTLNLADLEISNIKVIIGTNGDGNQNSNVGNGIGGKGTLNLSGTANISGIFTDQKNNTIGAGIVLTEGSKIQGAGSIVITGSASTDSAYPYGINNGIMMDASKASVALELTGDITVTDVTNVGIYLANSAEGKTATLSARNVTVTNAGSNGVYNRGTYSYFTATGIITVDQAKGHGLNNEGAVTAGAITISNAAKNGINVGNGSTTEYGIIKAENIMVTNAGEHGIVQGKNGQMIVSDTITVDGFTIRGISNTQSGGYIKAKNIVVKNGTGAKIDAGIKNSNASAQILVSGDVTVSNIGGTAASEAGNGITNTGIIKITGTLKVEKVTTTGATDDKANCGIWNKGGSIEAGAVIVDQVATKAGIYINGGSLKATTVAVSNITKFVGIFMDTKATLQATDVLVQNTGSQAIQANHDNTITVTNMVIIGSTNNGLRLYNNNNNPTVKIDLLVAYKCAEYGLAAGKQLTSDNLTVTAMYYENCANGVHVNIKSGVTAAQGIPQAVREALAAKGITLPASN